MWKIALICVICSAMASEGAGATKKRYVSAGGYAGSGASAGGYGGGGGYTGGYVGGYAGDYAGTGFVYAPDFGLSAAFIDPYVFHQQLTAQIHAQHAAQQNLIHRQIAAQQAYFDAARRRNQYSNKGYKTNRYAPNYAAASGSIGPGGYYQTAAISPGNPGVPNVVNRFSTSSGPGGYKGVSVSSYSSSADVNGKRTGVRGAQTTVNDNGKVTTYSVHS